MKIQTANLGFPRIGKNRELKRALEAYWEGRSTRAQLETTAKTIRRTNWLLQKKIGIDFIPSNDFSLYDHVLDTAAMLGAVPKRYLVEGRNLLDSYFAMARGDDQNAALPMSKWFDTNYHYIVPELSDDMDFKLVSAKVIDEYKEAKLLGVQTRPVLLGPITFLMLSRVVNNASGAANPIQFLDRIVPVYQEVLKKLEEAGAVWVQMDEPCLSLDLHPSTPAAFLETYSRLKAGLSHLKIMLTTYFGHPFDNTDWVMNLPVDGVHVDCTSPERYTDLALFRPDKVLSLGLVNGRNVWLNDLAASYKFIKDIKEVYPEVSLLVAPSCSLIHVPITVENEEFDTAVSVELAFAVEKLQEVETLATLFGKHKFEDTIHANTSLRISSKILEERRASPKITNEKVQERLRSIDDSFLKRKNPYEVRSKTWDAIEHFPTTTIGSFPQTPDLRRMRASLSSGSVTKEDYERFIEQEIAANIKFQEDMGLDVLVHGESERNDMVQYFAEQLDGFIFTKNGWVQSYGSRCVKPPIIYGDVSRREAISVRWIRYAQSLTTKPVKGILTGPVTMVKWSFPREDQSVELTTKQLALAIRDEVADLEWAGIKIIQIDEPAFREAAPLRLWGREAYFKWAVEGFHIATSVVNDDTQIHTHMCYSDFNSIIDPIVALDADVLLIEASRSNMNLLKAFRDKKYLNGIGVGVFDVHSPRIPTQDEIEVLILRAMLYFDPEQIWINPDCGLKTRNWNEVGSSLTNMVRAATSLRNEIKFGPKKAADESAAIFTT